MYKGEYEQPTQAGHFCPSAAEGCLDRGAVCNDIDRGRWNRFERVEVLDLRLEGQLRTLLVAGWPNRLSRRRRIIG